jgi:hypothetical protein
MIPATRRSGRLYLRYAWRYHRHRPWEPAGRPANPQEPVAAANLVDVAAIVFSRGKTPTDDVVALANKAGIGLLGFEGDTWTLAKKLYEIGVR